MILGTSYKAKIHCKTIAIEANSQSLKMVDFS